MKRAGTDYFDVVMFAYNVINHAFPDHLLNNAREKGIGLIAMKAATGDHFIRTKQSLLGLSIYRIIDFLFNEFLVMAKRIKEIRTEVIINASPSKIWEILMDFEKYTDWNPFIRSINGQQVKGSKIKARLEPPDSFGMTINPVIINIISEKELRWLGHLFIPGLFDGEHIFELIDNENGTTTFIQREKFRGILIPFFKKLLDYNTRMGFELMNHQLKIESEKQ